MIIVDSGEPKKILESFQFIGEEVVVKEIRVRGTRMGDFTNDQMSFIAERKTTQDLLESMKDRRIYNQMHKIHANFSGNKYLIIEGSLWKTATNNPKMENWVYSIRGEAASVYGFSVIETKNPHDTAQAVKWLDRKCGSSPSLRLEVHRSLSKKIDRRLASLCEIEGVNLRKAVSLAKMFGTLRHVSEAEAIDFEMVEGIGPILSRRIFEHFNRAINTGAAFPE